MGMDSLHLLIVEDSSEYAHMLKTVLGGEETVHFEMAFAGDLKSALRLLDGGEFDVILLDLSLPDSLGLDTFLAIQAYAMHVPIVVITALDDAGVAVRAVREGAQDYLVKGDLDVSNLVRSLRYAVERHRMLTNLENKLLIDDLTGLYNRRGFMHLAAQQLKLARRMGTLLLLIFIDLDDLKKINDQYGHTEGDQALATFAEVLTMTFRESDILGRVGGDEFAVLAINVQEHSDRVIAERLGENLATFNQTRQAGYEISPSMGMVYYDPQDHIPLDTLLSNADALMYDNKRRKKGIPVS
jgi:two-component system, cell cycle response regulator